MTNNIDTQSEIVQAVAEADPDMLAAIIRHEIQAARKAWSNALDHAMAAGDALIAVQPLVTDNWKTWLKENCAVAVSTAELYMQLARNRDKIEPVIQSKGELSLRGARQLISHARESDDKPAASPSPENTGVLEILISHWTDATKEERAAFLDAIGVDAVLGAMSSAFGRDLRARVPANQPNKKSKTLKLAADHVREMRDSSFRH